MTNRQPDTVDQKENKQATQGAQSMADASQLTALFQQALEAHKQGQLAAAESFYRQLLSSIPDNRNVLSNLATLCCQTGNYQEAVTLYGRLFRSGEGSKGDYLNMAVALDLLGHDEQAEQAYRTVLALSPENMKVLVGLAGVLMRSKRYEEAEQLCKKAQDMGGDNSDIWNNLGLIYRARYQAEQAEAAFRKAIALNPSDNKPRLNLVSLLSGIGKTREAEQLARQALQSEPDNAVVCNALGAILQEEEHYAEAETMFRNALKYKADYSDAQGNLGGLLQLTGRMEESIRCFEQVLVWEPDSAHAAGELLTQYTKACEWDKARTLVPKVDMLIDRALEDGEVPCQAPFDILGRCDDKARCRDVARAWSRDVARRVAHIRTDFSFADRKGKSGKIVLGYLSSDFRNHPGGVKMQGLFELHDRDKFIVNIYSTGEDDGSDIRRRIEKSCDNFVDIMPLTHAQAAEKIYSDGVDILMNRNGHTQKNYLEVNALRPAPLQLSYLGFVGSMGADFLDYIVMDRIVAPEGDEQYFDEKLVLMPHCLQANSCNQAIADTEYTRAECGLPEDAFVFCSFNRGFKIEPVMFEVWMRLLKALPGSVLWLWESNDLVERNLRAEAKKRGVEPERLVFASRLPNPEFLARTKLADLGLDTRIYGGHVMTSDTLWAGVPVITLLGNHWSSRFSSSIVTAMGLPELVTHSLEAYEALARKLAENPEELGKLKEKLQQNRLTAPLYDTRLFVTHLEEAYGKMWELFQSDKAPERIEVRT